jgi:chromosome segregation ATPase
MTTKRKPLTEAERAKAGLPSAEPGGFRLSLDQLQHLNSRLFALETATMELRAEYRKFRQQIDDNLTAAIQEIGASQQELTEAILQFFQAQVRDRQEEPAPTDPAVSAHDREESPDN